MKPALYPASIGFPSVPRRIVPLPERKNTKKVESIGFRPRETPLRIPHLSSQSILQAIIRQRQSPSFATAIAKGAKLFDFGPAKKLNHIHRFVKCSLAAAWACAFGERGPRFKSYNTVP